jgi:hypothetical protein
MHSRYVVIPVSEDDYCLGKAEDVSLFAACMNLRQFPYLKTNSCICDFQGVVDIQTLASNARGKAIWLLVGISCAVAGILLSIINVAADIGGVYVAITPEIVRCSCLYVMYAYVYYKVLIKCLTCTFLVAGRRAKLELVWMTQILRPEPNFSCPL